MPRSLLEDASPQAVCLRIIMPDTSSAREKVLREWHRVDTTDEAMRRDFRSKEAGSLVEQALGGLRLEQRSSETQILKAWNHLLDPVLCEHAHPVGIRKGTLFVQVDHPTWLSEIVRYRRHEILERLQHCFGKEMIQRVSYRIG